jgi:hypothetical protein
MRFCGKMEPGSGGGQATGQPYRFAYSGSSPARYLALGAATSRAGASVLVGLAVAVAFAAAGAGGGVEAVGVAGVTGIAEAAGAAGAFCAVGAISTSLNLSFVKPARATNTARTVASRGANIRI